MNNPVYPESISQLINSAIQRMLDEMRQGGPYMAHHAELWIKTLPGSEFPAAYFKHPLAFPMLLLPLSEPPRLNTEFAPLKLNGPVAPNGPAAVPANPTTTG